MIQLAIAYMITCRHCNTAFLINDADRSFYKKIEVPEPTLCPQCRLQRRLAFRNERNLYKRSCDLCKKEIISSYDSDSPFTIYCKECWWSDAWDPKSYGRDFDFNRPFFEQFKELMLAVPKAGSLQLNNENSEYNSYLAYCKNTYMSPGSYFSENCFFLRKSQNCRDCISSNALNKCELVALSTNCDNCYQSHHLLNCRNCSFSSYLSDCLSLESCFMCVGLRNKKHCIKNVQYTPEDYASQLAEYQKKSPDELDREFKEFMQTQPQRAQIQLNCENSNGDYLQNCKNAQDCFDCFNIQDSRYLSECVSVKDSMDLSLHDEQIELCYELCSGGEKNYFTRFDYCVCDATYTDYSFMCFFVDHLFGCDGIHSRSSYLVLNKQYTKEEYEALSSRIIEHMKQTKEFGEFFPHHLSPFVYNETLAQDYFPITEETARAYSIPWKEKKERAHIAHADVITCTSCGNQHKVITQERDLFARIGVPVPTICPDCRYRDLISKKNPRHLWTRSCSSCGNSIQSTFAPERTEMVLCENCYVKNAQ